MWKCNVSGGIGEVLLTRVIVHGLISVQVLSCLVLGLF